MTVKKNDISALTSDDRRIIGFLQGIGGCRVGGIFGKQYRFEDIVAFSDAELEKKGYMPWVFPTMSKSSHDGRAPSLSKDGAGFVRQDEKCTVSIYAMLYRMMGYLGYRLEGNTVTVSDDFEEKRQQWLYIVSPAYLGITRILDCLVNVIGDRRTAEAFLEALADTCPEGGKVTYESLNHWTETVYGIEYYEYRKWKEGNNEDEKAKEG